MSLKLERNLSQSVCLLPIADIGESEINGCIASVSGHSAGYNVAPCQGWHARDSGGGVEVVRVDRFLIREFVRIRYRLYSGFMIVLVRPGPLLPLV